MFMTIFPIIGLFAAVLVFKKKFILTDKKLDEISEAIHRDKAE